MNSSLPRARRPTALVGSIGTLLAISTNSGDAHATRAELGPRRRNCKEAHQFDMPIGVRFDSEPGERDHSDRLAVAQQRHRHCRAYPILFGLWELVVRFVLDVGDPHHVA